MKKKIIDLSVALETGINSDPPSALPKIDYISHQDSAEHVCSFFPGLEKDDLPEGEGWAVAKYLLEFEQVIKKIKTINGISKIKSLCDGRIAIDNFTRLN